MVAAPQAARQPNPPHPPRSARVIAFFDCGDELFSVLKEIENYAAIRI
jgi:hypothetical protein